MFRRVIVPLVAFLAALGALKIAFALTPPQGLLREDGLFPLWALWERGRGWVWFLPPLLAAAAVALAVWRGASERTGTVAFLTGAMVLSAVAWCSLASTNAGFPSGLTAPFERGEDYWASVPRFATPREVWSEYVARQAGLSLHASTHPPGAIAVLTALSAALGGHLTWVCLAVVVLGTLTIPALYGWSNEVAGRRAARGAVLAWATTPAVLLYGATCMDMVFAVPLAVAGWSFHRAISRNAPRAAAVAGLALGVGLLFTFAGGILALAFGLVAASKRAWRPLAITACASVGVLLAIRLGTGFDWWECFRTAARLDAAEWPAWSSPSYYGWTRLMGVFDALVMFGAALSASWLDALARDARDGGDAATWGRAIAVACLAALLTGAFKIGETGRILLFALPAVVIPVARRLEHDGAAVGLIAAAGFAQALVLEAVLDTRW